MSNSVYTTDIPSIGNLRLEKMLVYYEYPLLTVLKSRLDSKRYLCFCYAVEGEREETVQKWAIAPVSIEDLKRLLKNEISLAAPFKNPNAVIMLAERAYKTKTLRYALEFPEEVPIDKLPDDDEFLDADPNEWDDYIAKLSDD